MVDLEKAIGVILAAHPGPTVQRLMLDLWALGLRHGETEGLRCAAMYLKAITEYERQCAALAVFGKWSRAEETECASS